MNLIDKLGKDIVNAMKEKEQLRLSVLRMVKGAIQLENINNKKELNDELFIDVVSKQIKQRNESLEEFKKAERTDLVNKTIQTYAASFLKNKDNLMVYDSQLNGQVLSILLKMLDYSSGYSFPDISFHTYNFDLTDQTLMSDEEVLKLFNVTEKTVRQKIQDQFEFFYNDVVAKKYIVPQECDYECFLTWRNIDDYMDSVYYYIEDGKLYAYRPFTIYSVYGEEEYFTDESYKIYITE